MCYNITMKKKCKRCEEIKKDFNKEDARKHFESTGHDDFF